MGLQRIYHQVNRGFKNAKGFLGNAYKQAGSFMQGMDRYAGLARNVVGAVAPIAGSLSGPVGQAVGAAVGAGMKGLGTYDSLKTEAMAQGAQMGNVVAAARRGLK